jgi:hypothetical protein
MAGLQYTRVVRDRDTTESVLQQDVPLVVAFSAMQITENLFVT